MIDFFCEKEKNLIVVVEASVLEDANLIKETPFLTFKDQLITFNSSVPGNWEHVDLVICLGGDGTLLYTSSLFQVS